MTAKPVTLRDAMKHLTALAFALTLAGPALAAPVQVSEILAKAPAADWRPIDPETPSTSSSPQAGW